jgi:16S rRNA (cytidine1402-2'-O)-methyltransferase
VARELTKVHEEIVRGTLAEVARYYEEKPPRGEVTLVVAPAAPGEGDDDRPARALTLARELLDGGMKPSAAARQLAARLDLARNEAYRIVHDLEDADGASREPAKTDE